VILSWFHTQIGRWHHWRARIIEWLSFALLASLIVVPLGMLGWLVFFTDTFVVRNMTVVDARPHTADAVRSLTEGFLNKNILFIQTPYVEQQILAEIPQIRDVYIARKLPDTLKITVQEKTPLLLLLSNTRFYFIDAEGVVYEEAGLDTLPGIVLPVVKNTDTGAQVTLGVPVVESSFVEFVYKAEEYLPDIVEANIAEIRIPSLAAREVHFLLDNNILIRLDSTRALESQLNVLDRLLEHTIPEETWPDVEYIDLRIPNRVYYKLRGV
jgi:cell division septal protein FtsQ